MSDMIVFFALIALTGIFYVMFYNEYVLSAKVNNLTLAHEFRFARNQNAELILLLTKHQEYFQNTNCTLNGLSYNAAMDNLQNTRDKVYSTTSFKILVGKLKQKNKSTADKLKAEVYQQIKIQQEIKAGFNRITILSMAA